MLKVEHETHVHLLSRFLLALALFTAYFFYVVWKFDVGEGSLVALLTWAFFVLSTPIADAGLLLALPARVILGVKMIKTQALAYVLAVALVAWAYFNTPAVFEATILLRAFRFILEHPWPYWALFLISAVGTFSSIYLADEMYDVLSHSKRKAYRRHGWKVEAVITLGLVAVAFLFYNMILEELGVRVPLL